MQQTALTVSDLNEYVRRSLAGDPMLHGIALRGELSNFKPYASGHWYFSLKDENSRIQCVMFRQYNMALRLRPQDGMRVVLRGSVGLYVSSGSYQFYAEHMQEDGVGELFLRFNALKEKLLKEGLFDPMRKRPLPLLPRAVGIVTSASGAVLHDIKTVSGRRFPGLPLILRPAQVQGEGAAEDLARGLQEIAALPQVDVVIIGRGGGSMEDLWAFNEEILVRAVAACGKPVISAVGHETDTTLCDFAADMRAPTPSAAAELAVPDRAELLSRLVSLQGAMDQAARAQLMMKAQPLEALRHRLMIRSPEAALQSFGHRVDLAIAGITGRMAQYLQEKSAQAGAVIQKLRALGPGQTLARGYAMALKDGRAISSVAELPEVFTLAFHDGSAQARRVSLDQEEKA